MISKLKNIAVIIVGSSLGLGSCKNSNKHNQEQQPRDYSKNQESKKRVKKKKKESPKESSFLYVNRTAVSTQYKYDYEVYGTDEEGTEVQGNINIEGKNGEGELIKNNSEKIEIVVEWLGNGKLVATDIEGNEYKLKID